MTALRTVNASISMHNWIGATYEGYDSFLGTSVIAYEAGAQAKLLVRVYSDYRVGPPWQYHPVNVSAVKIWADWNINYTSTEVSEDSPIMVEPYQYRTFTIIFTIPNTTIASNLVAHNYQIYVEHVDSTTGAKRIVGTWTSSGSGLAVYSAEQSDCMKIHQKYAGMSAPTFTYPGAEVLWARAMLESSIAERNYQVGNFTDAQTHFRSMDNLVAQAFDTEATKGSATADAATVEANAAMMQSYCYILLGLGLTLFGIGAIIYGMSRQS